MEGAVASRLVRVLPWAEVELVEGARALLWPAGTENAAPTEEPPDPSSVLQAVVSGAKCSVLYFETACQDPVPDLLLVSTKSHQGPARFVVAKSYQAGTTVACDPPEKAWVTERRQFFRVLVAAPVVVRSPFGDWSLWTIDCSLGGLCTCTPAPLRAWQRSAHPARARRRPCRVLR